MRKKQPYQGTKIPGYDPLLKSPSNDLNPDALADLIVERLLGNITVSSEPKDVTPNEPESNDDAAFDAALSFLDSF